MHEIDSNFENMYSPWKPCGRYGKWLADAVRSGARGPRGETPLHWALSSGDAVLAKSWLRHGGAFEADAFGAYPVHWLASLGGSDEWRDILADVDLSAAVSKSAGLLDAQGRDFMGFLILSRKFWIAMEAAPRLRVFDVHFGNGVELGIFDAFLAAGADGGQLQGFEKFVLDCSALGAKPPSLSMPGRLAGGFWTPQLWSSTFKARAPSCLKAIAERSQLDCCVGAGQGSLNPVGGRL